jgi:Bin/amphiphysin/Rvs domain for vesicular trafficking
MALYGVPEKQSLMFVCPRSQYSQEAYDYPPNIRESFNDLGRTISEKVQLLSHATSPAEAQAALTAPPSARPQPKTFNHAIARASLAGSQVLAQSAHGAEDPLATAMEKYALAMEKVGEARLAQDAQIQSHFLAGWNTTLNTNLMFATRARKNVENSRLMLDSIKASKKATTKGDLDHAGEDARAEIEQAEDEFVGQTEEAVSVMKNVFPPSLPRGCDACSLYPGLRHANDCLGAGYSRAAEESRRLDRGPAGISQKGL